MRIAVTGGIGCGKSTVLSLLKLQAPANTFVSVDDMVRGLYDDPEFRVLLKRTFGVDTRQAVSDLVFGAPDLREKLELLTKPLVRKQLDEALQAKDVFVEFPLLFEVPGYLHSFDAIVVIGCDEALQRERVKARDGMTDEKLDRVLGAQYSLGLKKALADVYIDTGCSVDVLKERVTAVWKELVRQAEQTELEKALFRRCSLFFSSEELARRILGAYKEGHRAYHTLEHLKELFEVLDPHLAGHPYRSSIECAVWFHDYVYSTDLADYKNNEPLSARSMFQLLRQHKAVELFHGQRQILLAAEFILATQKHRIDAPILLADPQVRDACALFLDADLSILAADEARLLRYDDDIALEWCKSKDSTEHRRMFSSGRAQALATFLKRDQLYLTPQFEHLETPARANLTKLIERWESVAT